MGDDKIDKDGIVHEPGWDNQYRPKQGVWGSQKDTNLFGQPNVERDFFGNPKVARNWFGQPIQSRDGVPLYQRQARGKSGGSGSGEGGAIFWIILAILGFVFVILFVIVKFVFKSTQKGFQAFSRGEVFKGILYFVPLGTSLVMIFIGVMYFQGLSSPGSTESGVANENVVNRQSPALTPQKAVYTSPCQAGSCTKTPSPTLRAVASPTLTLPSPSKVIPTPAQSSTQARIIVVIRDSVYLRAGPGIDYKIVGYAHKGDQFEYFGMDVDGFWYQVDHSGNTWIASSVVELKGKETEPAATSKALGFVVVVPGSVFLRAGPGKEFGVVGYAYYGDELPVYGRNVDGTWIQVDQVSGVWIAVAVITYEGNIADLPILSTGSTP